MGCVGYLDGPPGPPTDECYDGIFYDAVQDVSILVVHYGGVITASVWKGAAASLPWTYLYFNGNITERGEASGEMTLYFSESGDLIVPDVVLTLPNDRECNLRNTLTFSLAYTWEGMAHGENFTLTRQTP